MRWEALARDAFPPVAAGVCRARPFADSAGRRYQMRPKGWRSNFVVCNPMTIKGHSDSKLLEDARACGNSLPFKDAQPWPGTFSEGRADVARGPGGGRHAKWPFWLGCGELTSTLKRGQTVLPRRRLGFFFFLAGLSEAPLVSSLAKMRHLRVVGAVVGAVLGHAGGGALPWELALVHHDAPPATARTSATLPGPGRPRPPPARHLSSILVLARSSFSRISGSWASSSQAEPQPKTRARSLPVPRGRTPSWHWGRHRDVSGRVGVRRGPAPSPVCAASARRSRTAPSPRCRRLRTPKS